MCRTSLATSSYYHIQLTSAQYGYKLALLVVSPHLDRLASSCYSGVLHVVPPPLDSFASSGSWNSDVEAAAHTLPFAA